MITTFGKEFAFTENRGQISDQNGKNRKDILFYGSSNGLSYFLKNNGISYQITKVGNGKDLSQDRNHFEVYDFDQDSITFYRTDISWIGANKDINIISENDKSYKYNFYLSSCPNGITGVKSYEKITYQNLYDNIDLVWYGNDRNLEYDFIVKPYADYKQIKLKIFGPENISINDEGQLILQTPFGEIIEDAPKVYQDDKLVKSNWKIHDDEVSFSLARYDKSKSLRIDPIVMVKFFGTYYGGIDDYDVIWDIEAEDISSSVLATGTAYSGNFIATSGSYQSSRGGGFNDAFLARFDSTGSLAWGTFFGGNGNDAAYTLVIDDQNEILFGGSTFSTDVIADSNSYQDTLNGPRDAFLAKFTINGFKVWSTYFGGSYVETINNLCLDNAKRIYAVGSTESNDLAGTSGTFQDTIGGQGDGMIVKFDAQGNLIWSTYVGGTDDELLLSCDVDNYNNLVAVGYGRSDNGVASTGCFQPIRSGNNDGYIFKYDSLGNRIFGTYFGGPDQDDIKIVKIIDSAIYITGEVWSTSGLATINSLQTTHGGSSDAILAKFNINGFKEWATYYGGSGIDRGVQISEDDSSFIYLFGHAGSPNNIGYGNIYNSSVIALTDGFIAKFNSSGNRIWGTYAGGNNSDDLRAGCMLNSNRFYLAGQTYSGQGIATPGSYKTVKSSSRDCFIIGLKYCNYTEDTITVSVCDSLESPSGKHTWFTSGTYIDTSLNGEGCDSIVHINLTVTKTPDSLSIPSNFQFCDSGQINLSASFDTGSVYWYDSLIGGNLLANSINYLTPTIYSNSSYFVEAINGSCNSNRYEVQLIVNNSDTVERQASSCKFFRSDDSLLYVTKSGEYPVKYSNNRTCDSIEMYTVTILNIDDSISLNGSMLSANTSGLSYQWYNCDSNIIVAGQTSQSYSPLISGKYSVIVSDSNCTDTSNCVYVEIVGIERLSFKEQIAVFPNPNNGQFTINISSDFEGKLSLINTLGSEIWSWVDSEEEGKKNIQIEPKISGIYLLQIEDSKGVKTLKIIVN